MWLSGTCYDLQCLVGVGEGVGGEAHYTNVRGGKIAIDETSSIVKLTSLAMWCCMHLI